MPCESTFPVFQRRGQHLNALPSKPTALDQAIYGTCVAVSTVYILRCLSMLQGSPAFREHLSIPMRHYNQLLERLRGEGVSLESYMPRFVSSDEGNALVWVVEGLNSMGCVLDWMYPYSTGDMQSTAAPGYMDEPPGHMRLLCRLSKLFLPTVHYHPIVNQGHMETSLSSSSSPSGIIVGASTSLKVPLIIVMGSHTSSMGMICSHTSAPTRRMGGPITALKAWARRAMSSSPELIRWFS